MRVNMSRVAASIGFLIFSATSLMAQGQNEVRVEYDPRQTDEPRIIAIYNLVAGSESDCPSPFEYKGTIVQIKYDDDTGTRIIGFTISDRNERRTYFNIDEDFYEESKLPAVDMGWIDTLLRKGRRVEVLAYACGAVGRVLMANNIIDVDAPQNRAATPSATAKARTPTPSRNTGSPFEARYVGGNRAPEVQVTNNADRTLNLAIGQSRYTIKPSANQTITLEPGVYEFQATAPNVMPLEGEKDFQRGYVYTWTFYIRRSTGTYSRSPRIIPRRRRGRRP